MRDCARCCLLLPFVEPTKMLCQALFKQRHRASSSPPLPHASPLPQSHTEATENSDPLCEQGAARKGNLKSQIQTVVAFLRRLRAFQRTLLFNPGAQWPSLWHNVKKVKLRGGWTEMQGSKVGECGGRAGGAADKDLLDS